MPLSPSGSGHADDLGRSEGREAVHQGDAYLDFRSLTVGVSGGDALTEGFETPHLCLDPASDVVSGPALPECPAIVPGGTQGFVSSDCSRTVLLPRPPVLADRDDCSGLPVNDGRVATAGALDTRKCHDVIAARGAAAIIPPRKNAKPWKPDSPGAIARNEALRASRRFGRTIWRRWSGYHRRSRVETKMHCVKLLGQRLAARDFDRQVAEFQIRVAVLNGFTALGIPVTKA